MRLILIDPKQVELAFFSRVPHLMSPVVTDMKKALTVLEWLVCISDVEMPMTSLTGVAGSTLNSISVWPMRSVTRTATGVVASSSHGAGALGTTKTG